jgi:hypothetical protein
MPLAGAIPSGAVRVRHAVGDLRTRAALAEERMRKLLALPVLSSDALSSVAYGPEAMLVGLALAGSAQLKVLLPIAGAIIVLMIAVCLGYRQVIRAYPQGGGSYRPGGWWRSSGDLDVHPLQFVLASSDCPVAGSSLSQNGLGAWRGSVQDGLVTACHLGFVEGGVGGEQRVVMRLCARVEERGTDADTGMNPAGTDGV